MRPSDSGIPAYHMSKMQFQPTDTWSCSLTKPFDISFIVSVSTGSPHIHTVFILCLGLSSHSSKESILGTAIKCSSTVNNNSSSFHFLQKEKILAGERKKSGKKNSLGELQAPRSASAHNESDLLTQSKRLYLRIHHNARIPSRQFIFLPSS